MAFQFSASIRNAVADIIETTIGTAPTLEMRTGAPPASCAAADTGTLIASMTLPSDWLAQAASGVKSLNGTWQTPSANATGTAGHFRIKVGATCHIQGTVSQRASNGGTGDMQLDQATADIVAGQQVTVTAFTLTAGGA